MASKTRLWVAVADFVTAQSQLFYAQSGLYPLLRILKAAVAMPVVYNKLIDLGQVRGFDAGICNPFPLREAASHRCTHILVLLAKPESFVAGGRPWWNKALYNFLFARGSSRIKTMLKGAASEERYVRDLAHGRAYFSKSSPAIATISPLNGTVRSATQTPGILRSELIRLAIGTLRAFGSSESQLDAWLKSGIM